VRYVQEAKEVLANHDLRRRGLEGTANTYRDIVARIDEELATLT
jgi:hypothetical protein